MSPEPFGVYVHWPYCTAKCPYCDFNSHVRASIDEGDWVSGIRRELEQAAELQGSMRPPVETIFIGGGTPSLMRGASVAAVLNAISQLWRLVDNVEVTLECNPASADAARFADYRAAGVNRLSLGIQALNDTDLKALGRLHNVAEAHEALALAMRVFDRVSLDLIYARPGQTLSAWREELGRALAYGTEHLSLYQLTIEPETPFAVLARAGQLTVLDDDSAADLYELTQELTEAAGRPAYEISNHARPGAECRHNLLYWRYGDYAGVGPGAHGRLTCSGTRIGTTTERLPERWRAALRPPGTGSTAKFEIAQADAAREHLLMNLRLSEGLDLDGYEARWGLTVPESPLESMISDGLLARKGSRLSATPRGRLVLNRLTEALAV